MSTRATLAVNIETKRIRIAYALIQPNHITAAEVWIHCSKGNKQNQSGFSIRSNLYNGPHRNAVVISSASIDKSTFIKQMILVSVDQPWQHPAQDVWKRYFGNSVQSAQSLEHSSSVANAIPLSDGRSERYRSTNEDRKHTDNTANRSLTSLSTSVVPDPPSTVQFDAESREDMLMPDAEAKAAFYALDRPVSVWVIARMANLIRIQANTVELPPFDLVRRFRANLAVIELWDNIELLRWRDQARKQFNNEVADHIKEEEERKIVNGNETGALLLRIQSGRTDTKESRSRRGRYSSRDRQGNTSPRHRWEDDMTYRSRPSYRSRSPQSSHRRDRYRQSIRSPARPESSNRHWEPCHSCGHLERSDRNRERSRSVRRAERDEFDIHYR
jgi:hypothetical protein